MIKDKNIFKNFLFKDRSKNQNEKYIKQDTETDFKIVEEFIK